MVGAYAHMRSHSTYRITERSTILDLQSVNGIGIITAPDLRGIVKHSCLKSSTAAGTGFEKKIRISLHQALHHLIDSQNISVINLSLTFSWKCCTEHVIHTAVHIPLHIIHFAGIQHCEYLVHNVFPDFLSGNIQIQLIPASVRCTSRDLKCPVRMLPVQITVLGNHLRFYPQTEFQSQTMDLLCQCRKTAFDLLLIYLPVSKRTAVIISLSKPAVIQHKHIQSDILRFFCNVIELVCIEIEIRSFPVVD